MSDLPQTDSPTNAAEFTVSEISGALKRVVEDAFGNVRVRGEISGYRGPHSSGHAYFSLKDDRARIDAVVWRSTFGRLRFKPEEGMEVIATGRLTTYPGKSAYQIVIDNLEPAGAGALMALLEERRKKLEAEGLFAAERKRPLPYLPRVIGVVTSPTGAVIRDIIHRIDDRFPLHIIVWPVRVQGDTAGQEVAAAVEGFNALFPDGPIARPDLLIVARGGGSLEDLWGFNDEAVVRAVAASGIPVISAVGHETDWTLIDHAADMRAPTPTGAAELAVPVRADLEATLASLAARLRGCMTRNSDRKRHSLRAAARALPSADQLLALPRRRFDEAAARLGRGLEIEVERKRARLTQARLSTVLLSRRLRDDARHTARASERLDASFRGLVANRRARFDRDAARVTSAALNRRLSDLRRRQRESGIRLPAAFLASVESRRLRLSLAVSRINLDLSRTRLAKSGDQLSQLSLRSDRALWAIARAARVRLDQTARLAETLSYRSVLERGFALVLDAGGRLVKRASALSSGDEIAVRFADGDVGAVTTGGEAPKRKPASTRKPAPPGTQGDLF